MSDSIYLWPKWREQTLAGILGERVVHAPRADASLGPRKSPIQIGPFLIYLGARAHA